MPYDIYVLDEAALTISGGQSLDGVTQGDGSHLVGETITLNSGAWAPVTIDDDDANFQDNDTSQTLSGAQVVNGTSYPGGTVVEAEYSLVLSDGTNEWTVVGFNLRDSNPSYATVEGLAFIGGPGGFPPVGVPLTVVRSAEGPSFAAADFATPICFGAGTSIATPDGPRAVEDIAVGDIVTTVDAGPQAVRWRASRVWPARGRIAPVVFAPGAIGNTRTLVLSPQHRVRITGWRAQLWCAEDAILVPAVHFVGRPGVRVREGGTVAYHHIAFDAHRIVLSEGVETESFHPGAVGLSGLERDVLAELRAVFPDLAGRFGRMAGAVARGAEGRVLAMAGA